MTITFNPPAVRLDCTAEIALDADLSADPSSWVFTDITGYVRWRDGISTTTGRPDEASRVDAGHSEMTLDNRDGRFSRRNPLGAYAGQLSRNTPIRVKVDAGEGDYTLLEHYVNEWPVRWDRSQRDCTTPIKCAGVLRRLTQGTQLSLSPLRRSISAAVDSGLVAYWPIEDGADSDSAASGLPGATSMYPTNTVVFADYSPDTSTGGTLRYGTDNLANLNGGTLTGVVDQVSNTGEWTVAWFISHIPSGAETTISAEWFTPGGTYVRWRYIISSAGSTTVTAYDALDAATVVLTADGNVTNFTEIMVTAKQNGTGVDLTLVQGTNTDDSQTAALNTLAPVTSVNLNPASETTVNSLNLGHLQVWDTATPPTFDGQDLDTYSATYSLAWGSYLSESATERIIRLCAEDNIPLEIDTVPVESVVRMGSQPIGTLVDLLREAEAVDGGVLYEVGFGLGYQSRAARENADVAISLDFESGHIAEPPEPTDDDQRYRNQIEASRSGGSSYLAQDADLVFADGAYGDSVQVNVELDSQLPDQAGWRLHLSSVDEDRWPVLKINFAARPSLITQWAAATFGARVQIDNPPDEVDITPISGFIEGSVQFVTPVDWDLTLNTTPARGFDVGILASTSGDTDPLLGRLAESDDCELGAALTSGGLSASVRPGGTRWTTVADDFDPDIAIRVGGEEMTVSAIVDAAAFVSAGTAAHADNASIVPGLPGSLAAGDLMVMVAAIRSSGVGTVNVPAGWTSVASSGNFRMMTKTATGSDVAPTVTFTGGVVNDTTSAQICAFRNVYTGGAFVSTAGQLNGSAATIAYPALGVTDCDDGVVILWAWKQDNWTSAAGPGTFTEIGEPSSALGSNQGIWWGYQIQTWRAQIDVGVVTPTGGVSAISRAGLIAFEGLQTFTISARATNGVVKAHAAATPVEVVDALVLVM